jgi:LPXTG-site transpeptidase (sortase) family protein
MTDEATTPYSEKLEQRIVFALVSIGIFVITVVFFYIIDFLPERPSADSEEGTVPAISETGNDQKDSALDDEIADTVNETARSADDVRGTLATTGDAFPLQITFDSLGGRTVKVLNPESRTAEALDTALLSGVVRHPDSADFERTGTIFLFGHSSYLPNVMNKSFQAFNGIQKLMWGDIIRLESKRTEYVYRVDRVYEASALDAEVKIETGKARLTLVTCDSFGAKSDRFIVEATLIESTPIGA